MDPPQLYETNVVDTHTGVVLQLLSVPKSLMRDSSGLPLRELAALFEIQVYGELEATRDLPRLVGLMATEGNVMEVAREAERMLPLDFRASELVVSKGDLYDLHESRTREDHSHTQTRAAGRLLDPHPPVCRVRPILHGRHRTGSTPIGATKLPG